MNNLIIIDNEAKLNEIKVDENSTLFIFIDTYMSTKINKYLVHLEKNYTIHIFIRNIGKEVTKKIEIERKEIIESANSDSLEFDNYREYTLLNSAPNRYIDANVAIVSDEIQFVTFENTTNLLYVNESTIDDILERDIDLFLFITSWHGLYKELAKVPSTKRIGIFQGYIDKFKEKNIPIVFYSKEDPPNFQVFKNLSKKANLIFTSSSEMIPEYRKLNKTAKIENLTYGINPSHQAPLANETEKDAFMFAGTWFNGKYIERMNATKEIFEYIEKKELDFTFYNRNYYRSVPLFELPKKYKKYEHPALPYNVLLNKYNDFKYHINLNSVVEDHTMFAVRVLELQALGKKIISNYSLPVYVDFPNISIFNENLQLEFDVEDKILGIRNAFAENSVFEVWKRIFMGCKLEFLIPEDCEYEFSDDLTELEIKDLEIALNYSNVKYAKFTDDEKEYYTISSNLTGEYEGVNLGCDNNLVINLPKSKYYNYNKKLLYVELENYKYAVELDPDLYIIIFEDKIKNSQYIEKIFREKGFILISEFQLRDRITEKQNMNALSLINLLHYTEVIDIVKIINGKAVNYGTLRKDSSSFKQFVTEYKNSIKLNTRYNLNLDLLVYDINYLPEHGGTL